MTLLKTGACFTTELEKNCPTINACVPKVTAGAGVTVTGGTSGTDPYVVSAPPVVIPPSALNIQDEGTPQGTAGTLNFVGGGVTASTTAGVTTVTVAGSHTTAVTTCPATGPTVAPAAEGHYYYTSAIGEKWIWVYGDPAPYPFAKYYGENKSATVPANTALFTDTFIVPRDGTISISGKIATNDNTQQQADVFIYAGVPSENLVFYQRTLTDANDQPRNHANSGTATNVIVSAGDTITYSMRNDANSIAIYRIDYQYQS